MLIDFSEAGCLSNAFTLLVAISFGFGFTMDSSYEIEEYDSYNDLSGLTQEPSQMQAKVHGGKHGASDSDTQSGDEN